MHEVRRAGTEARPYRIVPRPAQRRGPYRIVPRPAQRRGPYRIVPRPARRPADRRAQRPAPTVVSPLCGTPGTVWVPPPSRKRIPDNEARDDPSVLGALAVSVVGEGHCALPSSLVHSRTSTGRHRGPPLQDCSPAGTEARPLQDCSPAGTEARPLQDCSPAGTEARPLQDCSPVGTEAGGRAGTEARPYDDPSDGNPQAPPLHRRELVVRRHDAGIEAGDFA